MPRIGEIARGTAIIGSFSVLAKLLGVLRDRLLANQFGASSSLDTYYAAFRIPDAVFNTLVLGALSAALVPVFLRHWQHDRQAAIRLSQGVLNLLLAVTFAIGLPLYLFAEPVARWIAPGFTVAQQAQVASLSRIMLLAVLLFTASNVFSSLLNAWKRFALYALAPALYNLGIILGIWLLAGRYGIYGPAWGVVAGACLHALVQWPAVHRLGWRYATGWRWGDRGVRQVIRLMLPRVLGLASGQIAIVVTTAIASGLAIGSVAAYNLANNLQSLPLGLLAVPLATAAFPLLAEAAARGEPSHFRASFSDSFRKLLFVLLPITVLLILLRAQAVRLVLGSGAFDWDDTIRTAQVLGWFAVSVVAQGLLPLLARSFYALEDTRTPVAVALVSTALQLILAWPLASSFGVSGLAAAFSAGSWLNAIALLVALRWRQGPLDDRAVLVSTARSAGNAFLSGLAVYATLYAVAPFVDMATFLGLLIQAGVAAAAGLVSYLLLSLLTRAPEIAAVRSLIISLWWPRHR